MNSKRIFILLTILTLITLSACVRTTQVRGVVVVPAETHSHTVITRHEFPPHAPAHGHRHHYHNHDLRYDAGLGVYVVIGSPGLYFYGDHYLRFIDGRWQFRGQLKKPWRAAQQRHVPRKLRERYERDHRANRHESRHEKKRYEEKHGHRDEYRDAPRHGHRRNYQGQRLRYDAGIGAYRIIKQPGIYFYNDRYIRQSRGVWQVTKKLNGKWRTAKEKHVPSNLWRKKNRNHKKHERREHDNRRNERRSEKQRHEKRRDEDQRHEERNHEERRYDDGKKLRNINEKFFQGMEE